MSQSSVETPTKRPLSDYALSHDAYRSPLRRRAGRESAPAAGACDSSNTRLAAALLPADEQPRKEQSRQSEVQLITESPDSPGSLRGRLLSRLGPDACEPEALDMSATQPSAAQHSSSPGDRRSKSASHTAGAARQRGSAAGAESARGESAAPRRNSRRASWLAASKTHLMLKVTIACSGNASEFTTWSANT